MWHRLVTNRTWTHLCATRAVVATTRAQPVLTTSGQVGLCASADEQNAAVHAQCKQRIKKQLKEKK